MIGDGEYRDRTDDLLLAKQVLSQLSYAPMSTFLFLSASSASFVVRLLDVHKYSLRCLPPHSLI